MLLWYKLHWFPHSLEHQWDIFTYFLVHGWCVSPRDQDLDLLENSFSPCYVNPLSVPKHTECGPNAMVLWHDFNVSVFPEKWFCTARLSIKITFSRKNMFFSKILYFWCTQNDFTTCTGTKFANKPGFAWNWCWCPVWFRKYVIQLIDFTKLGNHLVDLFWFGRQEISPKKESFFTFCARWC